MYSLKKRNLRNKSLFTDKLGISLEELKKIRALNEDSHCVFNSITEKLICHSQAEKTYKTNRL